MREAYRKRRIHLPPNYKNFKPSGIPRNLLKSLTISVDEYEALRLADYEGLEHLQASERMGISRPTFTRLIEKARQKLAKAIIEGLELVVEGGNIEFQNTRRRCRDCGDEQVMPSNNIKEDCPECGSENVEDIAEKFLTSNNPRRESTNERVKMKDYRNRGNPGGGRGLGRGGSGGRNKGGAFGPGGFCVCAKCGEKVSHQQGVKCTEVKCPNCGHTMVREELLKGEGS